MLMADGLEVNLARGLVAVVLSYLLGSMPFAHLITRWRSGEDIRSVGVGNAGARNVWHVVGPLWGASVGVLDAAKGFAAVVFARAIGGGPWVALLAGPATIAGHAFPVFQRFRGGKGLGTTVGVLLAWTPESMLVGMAICTVTQLVLRNFDRSVIPGAAATILLPPAFGRHWTLGAYALCLFGLLWARKIQDGPHQQRVWASSGWRNVERSDWYGEGRGGSRSADALPRGESEGSSTRWGNRMAYDEGLAQRVREVLGSRSDIDEKKMFGGVGYLLAGNMACGVHGDRLIVRVGPERYADGLSQPHTREFDLTGRPMKGWLTVGPEGYGSDEALGAWIEQGLDFASSLPAK